MEKELKAPKLRFPGFTDDWELRKFSELYNKSSEKNDGSINIDKNITVATMTHSKWEILHLKVIIAKILCSEDL